jgi:molybdopterin molybdotransferase
VGVVLLQVARRPRIVIVSTGDELIDVSAAPEEHQLRASNGPALAALLASWADVSERRCGDDPTALRAALDEALSQSDVLLVTGGVSAGKFDLVPETIESLGVEKVFHKIAQKPGKPLWFGISSTAKDPEHAASTNESPRLVFGLPGNPVSSLVCARRYVLPLLWAKSGWVSPASSGIPAAYEEAAPASRLTRFLSARMEETDGIRRAFSVPINGSGDFAGFGGSDGFVEIPPAENTRAAGEKSSFFPWLP